ncbi:MAG: LysR family transcriptional regulator [Alphaproteobacteria bacterium]|nr:LysR family transcriptional regulator [Alphaproteobacteria bacterium]
MQTFDLSALNVFVEVARSGGVTAAAERLGLSKATVSLQLSRLEGRLGVKLFERRSRRVNLTREGERLLPKAQSLLAEVDDFAEEARNQTAQVRGIVRMTLTPAFGALVLGRLVPLVRRELPDIRLVIESEYRFDDLADPAFDFAVRIGKIGDDRLVARRLGSFRRVLVASPQLLARNRVIEPADLETIDCIVFSGRGTRHDWHVDRIVGPKKSAVIAVEAVTAVRDFAVIRNLALEGVGVAFLPEPIVRADLAEGRLVNCLPDWRSPPSDVMLAYRVGAARITRVRAVLDLAALAIGEALA